MAFTALNEKERGENKTLCIVIRRCNENDSCQIKAFSLDGDAFVLPTHMQTVTQTKHIIHSHNTFHELHKNINTS